MCILSDSEISALAGRRELIAENYSPDSLTPNGYDLRIASVLLGDVDSLPAEQVVIPGGWWFAVSTMERLALPRDMTGQLWIRSSFARKGVIASFGKVDAGFSGVLTLTGFNASRREISLDKGTRFVQLIFERMCAPSENGYAGRSGNYQGQDRLTLVPLRK